MIFIAGATGFIGRHLIEALRERGIKARCLVRTPEKAALCKDGLEAVLGDITDKETLRGKLEGAETVLHLVGIIEEKGTDTFRKVHVRGTENLVNEAKKAGVRHFFYQSALGAGKNSWSEYQNTKAEAEEIVRNSGIPYTIFRPSLVVGAGDGFTAKIISLIKAPSPVIPVPGKGRAKFQLLYVGDWVKCFLSIIDNPAAIGRTYEFGGPEHLTYNEIVSAVAKAMGAHKPLLHMPLGLAGAGVRFLENTPLRLATSEQLRLLQVDNICEKDSVKSDFGFDPVPFGKALNLFISPRAPGR